MRGLIGKCLCAYVIDDALGGGVLEALATDGGALSGCLFGAGRGGSGGLRFFVVLPNAAFGLFFGRFQVDAFPDGVELDGVFVVFAVRFDGAGHGHLEGVVDDDADVVFLFFKSADSHHARRFLILEFAVDIDEEFCVRDGGERQRMGLGAKGKREQHQDDQ